MKAVGYVSSATDEQAQYKKNKLLEYAQSKGIELSVINMDVGSRFGGIGFEFSLLMGSARKKEFDTLILPNLSCISRDMYAASLAIHELMAEEIRIIAFDDNLDSDDKGIKLGFKVIGEFGKFWEYTEK